MTALGPIRDRVIVGDRSAQLRRSALARAAQAVVYAADGSRRWMVARALEDDLLRLGACDPQAEWQRQLAEVFAEDYVALNGIDEWNRIALFAPPSRNVLRALAIDIDEPFVPSQRTLRGRVTRIGVVRRLVVHLTVPTFLLAELRGPRRAELDLRLYGPSRRRPIERSSHRGSRESLAQFVLPGRYTIEIRGRRAGGQWKLWLAKF